MSISTKLLLVGAALVGLCACDNSKPPPAAAVTLAWNPVPNAAGYRVYWSLGPVAEVSAAIGVLDVGQATQATIHSLKPGATYHFAATAYSTNGLESAASNESIYTAPTR
jgi:hypothetical protein